MGRGTGLLEENEYAFLGARLVANNIPYHLSKNNNGEEIIIIHGDSISNKSIINKLLAEYYRELSLDDESGFFDFLAKSYEDGRKNAN